MGNKKIDVWAKKRKDYFLENGTIEGIDANIPEGDHKKEYWLPAFMRGVEGQNLDFSNPQKFMSANYYSWSGEPDFTGSKMHNCIFNRRPMKGVILNDADFTGSSFRHVNLTGMQVNDQTVLDDVDVYGATIDVSMLLSGALKNVKNIDKVYFVDESPVANISQNAAWLFTGETDVKKMVVGMEFNDNNQPVARPLTLGEKLDVFLDKAIAFSETDAWKTLRARSEDVNIEDNILNVEAVEKPEEPEDTTPSIRTDFNDMPVLVREYPPSYRPDVEMLQDKLFQLAQLDDRFKIDLGKSGKQGNGVDGFFGELTENSVVAAQAYCNMDCSGTVDSQLIRALDAKIQEFSSKEYQTSLNHKLSLNLSLTT